MMEIKKSDHVKLFFYNGTQMEGIVEEWSNTQAVLCSEDNKAYLLINNITQDVMAIKVIPAQKTHSELQKEFEAAKNLPINNERFNTLAKLKNALNQQEREEIVQKFHQPTIGTGFVKYGDQFSALKGLKQYPKQQDSGKTE